MIQLLQPGDSILFERGSVFFGELKISASGQPNKEIYVGAYGSGINPVVSGSVEINNWTPFKGNIWVTDCAACTTEPGNLFIDGKFQTLGRYPNQGYMPFSCPSSCKLNLTDHHLLFQDGYWDGSEIVVKSSRWTLDNLPVYNYGNKTFYFLSPSSYPLPNGNGYFIQRHLGTLDKPGEWYFDKNSRKIFLYCKDGDKPSSHTIEVSISDVGLSLFNSNFITVENMVFKYQRTVGALVKFANNILLNNCQVEYSGSNGLEVFSCQNPTIKNCKIENSNNNGVEWRDNVNGSFIRNSIHRTGLYPGRGRSGNGTYIALSIAANNSFVGKNLFQYNSIDSTGYIGIDFRTGGTAIKNNLVSNFCMLKDDGAGIYTWGNSNGDNVIDGNIVLYGIGSAEGTNDSDQVWVHGIYVDDRSSDIIVVNNTIAHCGTTGLFIHNAKRLSVYGNTFFANGTSLTNKENAELSVKLDDLVPQHENKNIALSIKGNLLATRIENSHCIYLRADTEQDLKTLGSFNQNHYYAYRDQIIARLYGHQNVCDAKEELRLLDWQRCTGNDNDSQCEVMDFGPDESAGPNLIANSSMTSNVAGWIAWPSKVSAVQDRSMKIDGPSLRVQFPSGGGEALLYHAGISLNKNKMYRLSFSAKSDLKNSIEFAPLMASAPWEALAGYACFSIDTVIHSFSYFFKPNKSSKDARVNFKSSTTFWIDNVTLSEVVSKPEHGGQLLQLIYNATEKPQTIHASEKFIDIAGNPLSDPIRLPGYGSMILRRRN